MHAAEPKKAAQTVQPLVGSISKRLELLGHLCNLGIDMVNVGEEEAADGTVAVRPQGGGEQTVMSIQQFIDHVNAEVAEMTKEF